MDLVSSQLVRVDLELLGGRLVFLRLAAAGTNKDSSLSLFFDSAVPNRKASRTKTTQTAISNPRIHFSMVRLGYGVLCD